MALGLPPGAPAVTTPPVVTVERDGHVLLIGVDRAAERNAWDLQVIDEVGAAYDVLAADEDVRVGVVFGHGAHFSAGLDLAQVLPAVQEVVPAGQQRDRAVQIAHHRGSGAEHLESVLPSLASSADAAEGVQSFLERREARFTGR
jgi:enoyl-CoA hydratase/carnithine racemase